MAEVFVCYKREDIRVVREIVRALRCVGLDVWWDQDVPPGSSWEAVTEAELARARSAVVVWSRHSIRSDYVKAEARLAKKFGKLVQVTLGAEPPLYFGEQQAVDLVGWNGDAQDPRIVSLVESVRALLEGRASAIGAGRRPPPNRMFKSFPLLAAVAALTIGAFFAASVLWRGTRAERSQSALENSSATTIDDRARLLASIPGVWGNSSDAARPSCERKIEFKVFTRGEDDIIRIQSPGWTSEGRVVGVASHSLFTRTLTPSTEAGLSWELRIEADRLVQVDRDNVATVLVRCD